jgi:hypothetical protein
MENHEDSSNCGCFFAIFALFLSLFGVLMLVYDQYPDILEKSEEGAMITQKYYCEPWSPYCSPVLGCEQEVEGGKWIIEMQTASYGIQTFKVSCSKFNTFSAGDRIIFSFRRIHSVHKIYDRAFEKAPPIQ